MFRCLFSRIKNKQCRVSGFIPSLQMRVILAHADDIFREGCPGEILGNLDGGGGREGTF